MSDEVFIFKSFSSCYLASGDINVKNNLSPIKAIFIDIYIGVVGIVDLAFN